MLFCTRTGTHACSKEHIISNYRGQSRTFIMCIVIKKLTTVLFQTCTVTCTAHQITWTRNSTHWQTALCISAVCSGVFDCLKSPIRPVLICYHAAFGHFTSKDRAQVWIHKNETCWTRPLEWQACLIPYAHALLHIYIYYAGCDGWLWVKRYQRAHIRRKKTGLLASRLLSFSQVHRNWHGLSINVP